MRALITPRFMRVILATLLVEMAAVMLLHYPGFLTTLGADELDIGAIYGTSAAVALALRPAMARLIDLRGRRLVVLTGQILSAVALSALTLVDTLGPQVVIATVLFINAQILSITTLYAQAADVLPDDKRTQGLALFSLAFLIPVGLGSWLGDVLLDAAGFDALFLAALGFLAASMVVVALFAEPRRASPLPRRGFFASLRQPDLRPLWVLSLAYGLGLTAMYTWMRTFVDTSGIGSIGLFFGAFATTAVAASLWASALFSRGRERRWLAPGASSFVAGYLVLASTDSTALLVAAAILLGVGHAFVVPILMSLITGRARASERGSAMTILIALFDVSALFGAPAIGATIQARGYPTAFAAIGTLVAAGVIAYYLLEARAVARMAP